MGQVLSKKMGHLNVRDSIFQRAFGALEVKSILS